jgi:hypothetical protein
MMALIAVQAIRIVATAIVRRGAQVTMHVIALALAIEVRPLSSLQAGNL